MAAYTVPSEILESVAPRQLALEAAMADGDSDIQKFYCDSTVFVTGGTGFLGKQLIEKLFRSAKIKKMFLLIRPKKGKTVQERLDAILKDPVYDSLRQLKPDFASRIFCVEGDVSEIEMGISEQEWTTLAEEVNIIIHLAATTKFDELLRLATFINVRGTREAIKLAHACKSLKSFVHVSTAFCHATSSRVNTAVLEEFYPAPVPPEAMVQMCEACEDGRLYSAAPHLLEDWPNTYTFTKALAEEVVRKMSGNLPICVVRPPYVMNTYYEPTAGWVDNSCIYGPSGMVVGVGLGVIHTSLNKFDVPLSYCPADFVNNAIMAAGWAAGRSGRRGKEPNIYTVTNMENAVDWDFQARILRNPDTLKIASPKSLWSSYMIETSNRHVYWILTWLLHYIPAYLLDGFFFLGGLKKPTRITSFVKLYTKLYYFGLTFRHFFANSWYFDSSNLQKLYSSMSEKDKIIYNFDLSTIDWTQLIYIWLIGLRKFVVKDGLVDDGSGYRKQIWLTYANYVFFSIYFIVVAYVFKFVLSFVY